MVVYNDAKQPSLAQWTGSSLNTTILLDQPTGASFTNLDQISGRVVLRAGKSIDVSTIIVKLEGESRTRLLTPTVGNDRPKPVLEYHKILYRLQTVFPPTDVRDGRNAAAPGRSSSYTLPPGQHEYPFSFKIPFNNSCADDRSPMSTMNVTGSGLEIARPATRHVKKTLPPTLNGFPGEAEIRYFVKATVNRTSLFKENSRTVIRFNFFPIEPPRPTPTGSEVYARQRHSFNPTNSGTPTEKMKHVFGRRQKGGSSESPSISVDVRLPEPATLTCNSHVPMRLLVKRLSAFGDMLCLQSLQISLVASTKIRAHAAHRTEVNSWILMSKSNMSIPIGTTQDPADTETVLDNVLWRDLPLPNAVAPSFETCNIARTYQLDIRVGLSIGEGLRGGLKPQSIILPFRLEVQVYSGIAPPEGLLQAMADARTNVKRKASATAGISGPEKPPATRMATDQTDMHSNTIPITPAEESAPDLPLRPGPSGEADSYVDAPPSYEDAIAAGVGPVDAPRPSYVPPAPVEDNLLRQGEKEGWVD